ncbi:hypothetical protein STEG23_024626, partial [Scotinomys teguina]
MGSTRRETDENKFKVIASIEVYCLKKLFSRPGRPPKRTQSVTSPENSHIMPHSVPGLMSPGIIPPTVLLKLRNSINLLGFSQELTLGIGILLEDKYTLYVKVHAKWHNVMMWMSVYGHTGAMRVTEAAMEGFSQKDKTSGWLSVVS